MVMMPLCAAVLLAGASKESRPMPGIESEELLRLGFQAARLTYALGDMGVEAAGWPEPVLWSPGQGFWLLDPGTAPLSFRLVGLDLRGHHLCDVNLAQIARLSPADAVHPFAIQLDARGNVLVAAFHKTQVGTSGMLLTTTPQGKLVASEDLPGLSYNGKALVSRQGEIFNLEREVAAPSWYSYQAHRDRRRVAQSDFRNDATVVSGRVLEWIAGKDFRILESAGPIPLTLGRKGLEGELAGGDGPFFGLVRTTHVDDGGAAPQMTYARELTVLALNQIKGAVEVLGSFPLPPALFSRTTSDFTYYRAHQSHFDKDGAYYEIAWHPSSFEVHRSTLKLKP
jgi:hypothetical protein